MIKELRVCVNLATKTLIHSVLALVHIKYFLIQSHTLRKVTIPEILVCVVLASTKRMGLVDLAMVITVTQRVTGLDFANAFKDTLAQQLEPLFVVSSVPKRIRKIKIIK